MLTTAAALLEEPGFTIDEVARRSGVSKATIYKHWTGGYAGAVAAYGDSVTDAVPVLSTGDALADLGDQVRRLAAFYGSPRGRIAAPPMAAGAWPDSGPQLLRDTFLGPRRGDTVALLERGQADGQLRPIVFRLFNDCPRSRGPAPTRWPGWPCAPSPPTAARTPAVR